MALATFEDANSWLDGTRIKFESDGDAEPEADNAETVIKSRLYDVFPDLVNTWDTPAETPKYVRQIAAMLMASYRYARKYSAESVKKDSYSNWLLKQAEDALGRLASGDDKLFDQDVVVGGSGVPVGASLSRDDFYPNDYTGVLDKAQETKFTIRDVF